MARPHNAPDPFRAIAHPVRRRMLEMLRDRGMTAAELAEPFPISRGTISEHIRALRVAGLIDFRPRRNQHVYSLVTPRVRVVLHWASRFAAR